MLVLICFLGGLGTWRAFPCSSPYRILYAMYRRPAAWPSANAHAMAVPPFRIQSSLSEEGGRVRIAVVGAGAIGAYWGAALDRGGADVHLIARGAHLAAMRENGVRVLSQRGDFTAHPHVSDDPREIGAGRLCLPRPQGVLLPGLRPPRRTVARCGHGHGGGAERHPVVVLSQAARTVRGTPHRGGRSRRRHQRGAAARAGHRVRRLRGRPRSSTGRHQARGRHQVLHRRAVRRSLGALHGAERGHDRRRARSPRSRPSCATTSGSSSMGNASFNPISALTRRHDGRDLRAPAHRQVVAQVMEEILDIAARVGSKTAMTVERRLQRRRQRRPPQDLHAAGPGGGQAARTRRARHGGRGARRHHRRARPDAACRARRDRPAGTGPRGALPGGHDGRAKTRIGNRRSR